MTKKILTIALLAILLLSLLPGCVFISPDFRHTKNLILAEMGPVDVDTEFQIQIGSGLISLSGLIVSFTDARDNALPYLKDIHNIQVGVYRLKGLKRNRPVSIPSKIMKKLARKGYEQMVKAKEPGSEVWVMTKMRRNRLESLYVISVDSKELVLVEIKGRLERLIEKAVREHGFHKGEFIKT